MTYCVKHYEILEGLMQGLNDMLRDLLEDQRNLSKDELITCLQKMKGLTGILDSIEETFDDNT